MLPHFGHEGSVGPGWSLAVDAKDNMLGFGTVSLPGVSEGNMLEHPEFSVFVVCVPAQGCVWMPWDKARVFSFFFFFFVSVDSVYNAQWLFLSLEMLVFGFILRRDFFFSNSEEKIHFKGGGKSICFPFLLVCAV